MNKKMFEGSWQWLKGFFFNYLWLGVALLLISIILELGNPEPNRSIYITILIKLLEGIGVSILIAAIFSYASTTYDFIEKIRSLLEDIIIKRNFLGNIDPEGKKEALKSLIQPSDSEVNKYPNIGNYYGYFINKTLEIAKRSVRSNYRVYARAYVEKSTNLIAVEATYSYRLYPCSEGFHDITIGYEKKDTTENTCEYVNVSTPDGVRHVFKDDKLQFSEENAGGDVSLKVVIPVSNIGKGHDCLDVELKVVEYGAVNSMLYSFKALQPTDGFKLSLHCDGDLFVKSHSIFVVGANYYLDIGEESKSISITCNQWVNEGSGTSILIALPDSTALSEPKECEVSGDTQEATNEMYSEPMVIVEKDVEPRVAG